MSNTIFLTGGAGFIGSAVIRLLLSEYDCDVVNIDKLTYAGNLVTVADINEHPRYNFYELDICDSESVSGLFARLKPNAIIHLAAESHVDRSIDGPKDFIQTNIVGTYTLLECARQYMSEDRNNDFCFHHVSTDEVYGSLGATGQFHEDYPYQPNSPYSASKASSDHLVRAWFETFQLPVVLSNCSNNYGPYQYPEKLIPVIISKALSGKSIPIYGKGDNVRDWLYVEDHARALATIMYEGVAGRSYNVGGNEEKTNLQVATTVCNVLDKVHPSDQGNKYADLIEFVSDRPGHDQRYAIDATRIEKELGWTPRESFESGIEKTVRWYLQNQDWIRAVTKDSYDGTRLGSEKEACAD